MEKPIIYNVLMYALTCYNLPKEGGDSKMMVRHDTG